LNTQVRVFLDKSEEKKKEEVIVFSSRNDTRIEDMPIKTEVLGLEKVNEEAGIKPGNITSLLGNVAGIQKQQTSAVTGNTDLRIQGLPGDYTQLLRDGMPLFSGFAGSFAFLQLPPMDIKQIETIKGASSALYGGGAIGGMINIISKKPKPGIKERWLLLNQSTLKETNLNIYLSDREKKMGFTFFGGLTLQQEADVNKDGFSDVASSESFFIHPTIFLYPNEKNTISFGINSVFEDRIGGDMQVLIRRPNATHQFYIENQSFRNTFDVLWEREIKKADKLTVKGSGSSYNRNITSNVFGMRARQFSFYTEAAMSIKRKKHDVVTGINFTGELFKKQLPDSSSLSNYQYITAGVFAQDDWRMNPKLTLQSGLRIDAHNRYGIFMLPRISLLYKISSHFTTRFGVGLGYKIPTVFSSVVDERLYSNLRLDENAKAERSTSVNWDINFKKEIGEVALTINQSFYFTQINDPLVAFTPPGLVQYYTESKPINTKGIETWMQIGFRKLEAYLGYTLTDARKKYDPAQPFLELSARNKFVSVFSYKALKDLTVGVEAAYTGKQYLDNNRQAPGFPIIGAMIRLDAGRLTFILNGENLLDYRQTKKERIYGLPLTSPSFKQLWAPIDGTVVNLSLRIQL
jgi:outer membrane receptor for ferrienterochelin and colicin